MANPFPTLPICVTRKTIHDKATFPSDIKYVRTYDIPSISPTIPTGKGTALNLTSGVILLMLSDNNLNQHEKKKITILHFTQILDALSHTQHFGLSVWN